VTSDFVDSDQELGEGDRDPQLERFVDGQFIESAADVLDEGVPGDDRSGAAIGLQSAHRPQSAFQLTVIGLDPIIAYRSVLCRARGARSSTTAG
jgi:hypothetical protein